LRTPSGEFDRCGAPDDTAGNDALQGFDAPHGLTVTRLVLASRLADDLDRFAAHLLEHEAGDVEERLTEAIEALQLLTRHPLIGRNVELGRRGLVMGRGARGYVALYSYDPLDDVVAVAALRAQREAGFGGG